METISFKIDDKEKAELKEIFEEMGLDLSSGMRVYAKRVIATRSVPFELKAISNFEQSIAEYNRGEVTKVNNVKELMASLDKD